jgi:hypothetical protein
VEKIDLKYLKQFELFSSQTDMDSSIYSYIEFLLEEGVRKSVIDVLRCLGASSLRILGISFKKQMTMALALGTSRKTVNKALQTLEVYDIIDAVQTKTKAGRPSGKVYRIKPFNIKRLQDAVTSKEADEASEDKGLTLMNDFQPFEQESFLNNLEDNNAVQGNTIDQIVVEQLKSEFVPKTIVDNDFIELTKPYFNAKMIFKLFGIVKNAAKQSLVNTYDIDVKEAITEAFKASVFMYKMKRLKGSFENYFFGVLRGMFATVKRRQVMSKECLSIADKLENEQQHVKIPLFNWLEA